MSHTLYITKKLHVTPLCDIRSQEVARAYVEGLYEYLNNRLEPVSASSLVSDLQRNVTLFTLDGQHSTAAHDFVGYHLGAIHGAVITSTGSMRHNVATLAMLDTTDALRGYLAGRHFFFFEATPQERHITDAYLIERLHEFAEECTTWHDPDEVWQYAIACLLGEVSGQLFPVTPEEQAYWQAQDQAALAEMARLQAQHETESLDSVTVVEYAV